MKKKRLLELISKQTSGALTAGEASELDQLLSDPATQKVYEEVKLKWDQSGLYEIDIQVDKEAAWSRFQQIISTEHANPIKSDYRQLIYKVAAIVIVSIGLGFYLLNSMDSLETYSTAEGETREIVLTDGSNIFLNELTTLKVSSGFGNNDRVIELEGEGFFDIERNIDKPFIIHGAKTTVQVLGTSFNLEAYHKKQYVQVNVVSGSVSLYKKGDRSSEVILTQGMRGTHYLIDGSLQSTTLTEDNSQSWKTGTLTFDDVKMDEVIKDLAKYFNIEFETENEAILNCRFTSTFEKPTVDEVIQVLSATLNISGVESNNTYTLKGLGCTE